MAHGSSLRHLREDADADAAAGGGFLEVQNSRADGSRVVSPVGRGD